MRGARWALLAVLVLVQVAPIQAQSSIPNGVFVRSGEGLLWLVLDGQRVKIPVWGAVDADIAALPESDRWAVMNDSGAIVAGDRPAWFVDQPEPAAVAAAPQATATSRPAPTATSAQASAAPKRIGETTTLTSPSGIRLLVTVHSVKDNVKSSNQFVKPEGRFVSVEWSIKNDGADNAQVSYTSLKLVTVDGFVIDGRPRAGLPGPDFEAGGVGPGQTVRGFVSYDVPKDQALKSAIFHGARQIPIADLE